MDASELRVSIADTGRSSCAAGEWRDVLAKKIARG